jgi:hypothetical protein
VTICQAWAPNRWSFVCTFPAAVTSAALDSSMERALNMAFAENFPAEDFHKTKKFVLVCRSSPAFEISISFVLAQRKNRLTSAVNWRKLLRKSGNF